MDCGRIRGGEYDYKYNHPYKAFTSLDAATKWVAINQLIFTALKEKQNKEAQEYLCSMEDIWEDSGDYDDQTNSYRNNSELLALEAEFTKSWVAEGKGTSRNYDGLGYRVIKQSIELD